MVTWPNNVTYTLSSVVLWLAFLGALVALGIGRGLGWPEAALWALALTPAATVLIQTILAYRQVARADEFVRAVIVKRMIIATGLTLVLACAWSPLEEFLGLPHLPAWLIYPLFWGMFGVVSPFIRGSVA
ncbi:MAG: hypothetical protein KGJ79_14795 [Alphaproteobacteria bacterium]|nr:hypothetical protein [Alphaproteobacteria bacterium]MDE2112409.1 hypothetical protein [Alphaproteobacteria bacterium]MDE2495334.1 hypothetical protein [Alphaproteobacteria bacterium]